MSDFHQFRVDPDDPRSGDHLSRLLSAELEQERATIRRRRWMALVTAASIPVGLGAAAPHLLAPGVQRAALAVWAGALLATCAWLIEEWRGQRRLRALLTAGRISDEA